MDEERPSLRERKRKPIPVTALLKPRAKACLRCRYVSREYAYVTIHASANLEPSFSHGYSCTLLPYREAKVRCDGSFPCKR
jgi:hypothetical protein